MVTKKPDSAPKHGLVISDLHIFGNTTRFDIDGPNDQRIRDRLKDKDICVLNGDIFEFFYTKSTEKAVGKAINWLVELCKAHPNCDFHFVLGNHDAVQAFITNLPKAMEAHGVTNFHFHEHQFRLGDSLFIHGDEYMGKAPAKRPVYTQKEAAKSNIDRLLKRNELQEALYPLVKYYFRSPLAAAQNVLSLLKQDKDIDLSGVKHVVFGHTHVPFTGLELDGIHFHNSGGYTRLAKQNPLLFEYDSHTDRVDNVRSMIHDKSAFDYDTPNSPLTFTSPEKLAIPKKLLVISDLHRQSRLSTFKDDVYEHFMQRLQQVNAVVFNGDCDDLLCSKDAKEAMGNATTWYMTLAHENPSVDIHVVLGNHELVDKFVEKMKALSANKHYPNLHFHDHALQLGEALFIHGNEWIEVDRRIRDDRGKDFMPQKLLSLKQAQKYNGTLARNAYEVGRGLFQELRDTYCDYQHAVPAISAILKNHKADLESLLGINIDAARHVFYGHTHIPFVGFDYDGRHFHNTGAFVKSASAAPMLVSFDEGHVKKVEALDLGQGLQFGLAANAKRSNSRAF